NGLGCDDLMIKWCGAVTSASFCWACRPQRIKTTGSVLAFTCRMTSFVKYSQPLPLGEFGCLARTVKTVFNKRTPCFAQSVKHPWLGIGTPKSLCNSLKIFFNDGGIRTWG